MFLQPCKRLLVCLLIIIETLIDIDEGVFEISLSQSLQKAFDALLMPLHVEGAGDDEDILLLLASKRQQPACRLACQIVVRTNITEPMRVADIGIHGNDGGT